MKLVLQKDKHGCGPACLAMVTETTYEEVVKALGRSFDEVATGMSYPTMVTFLSECGYSVSIFWKYREGNRVRTVWPMRAWTEKAILQINTNRQSHFVVMDSEGYILDPACSSPRLLSSSEDVQMMMGVHKIAPYYDLSNLK